MAAIITLHITATMLEIKASKAQNNRREHRAPIFLQWSQEFWTA